MEVPFEKKICPPQQLAVRLGSRARPLAFTNGVFDILHRGHVTYLAEASSLGATLLVAVNSDASAKRLGKGEERPFNALADRSAQEDSRLIPFALFSGGQSFSSLPAKFWRKSFSLETSASGTSRTV